MLSSSMVSFSFSGSSSSSTTASSIVRQQLKHQQPFLLPPHPLHNDRDLAAEEDQQQQTFFQLQSREPSSLLLPYPPSPYQHHHRQYYFYNDDGCGGGGGDKDNNHLQLNPYPFQQHPSPSPLPNNTRIQQQQPTPPPPSLLHHHHLHLSSSMTPMAMSVAHPNLSQYSSLRWPSSSSSSSPLLEAVAPFSGGTTPPSTTLGTSPSSLFRTTQRSSSSSNIIIRKTIIRKKKNGVSCRTDVGTPQGSGVVRKRQRKCHQLKEQELVPLFSPAPTQTRNPSSGLKAPQKMETVPKKGEGRPKEEVSQPPGAPGAKRRRPYRTPSPRILRERREAANARERRRMDRLNQWFETLRSVLPAEAATAMAKCCDDGGVDITEATNKKGALSEGGDDGELFGGGCGGRRLSKFETLYTAQLYIARLNQLLLLGGGHCVEPEQQQKQKQNWIGGY